MTIAAMSATARDRRRARLVPGTVLRLLSPAALGLGLRRSAMGMACFPAEQAAPSPVPSPIDMSTAPACC